MNDVIWIVKDLSTNNILFISSDNSEIVNFMKNCTDKSVSCNKYVCDSELIPYIPPSSVKDLKASHEALLQSAKEIINFLDEVEDHIAGNSETCISCEIYRKLEQAIQNAKEVSNV